MTSNTAQLGMTLEQLDVHIRERMKGRIPKVISDFAFDCANTGYTEYVEQAREKLGMAGIEDAQQDLFSTLADVAVVVAKMACGEGETTVPLERIASVLRTLTESSAFRVVQYEHQFALETALAESEDKVARLEAELKAAKREVNRLQAAVDEDEDELQEPTTSAALVREAGWLDKPEPVPEDESQDLSWVTAEHVARRHKTRGFQTKPEDEVS